MEFIFGLKMLPVNLEIFKRISIYMFHMYDMSSLTHKVKFELQNYAFIIPVTLQSLHVGLTFQIYYTEFCTALIYVSNHSSQKMTVMKRLMTEPIIPALVQISAVTAAFEISFLHWLFHWDLQIILGIGNRHLCAECRQLVSLCI
jgi:hypothetical protein